MIGNAGVGRFGELPDVQGLAVFATYDSEISDLPEMTLGSGRIADEIAHDAALGQDPVAAAWYQPAIRYSAHDPARRLAISGRSKKDITGRQHHRSPGNRLNRNWRGLSRQFERANIT